MIPPIDEITICLFEATSPNLVDPFTRKLKNMDTLIFILVVGVIRLLEEYMHIQE